MAKVINIPHVGREERIGIAFNSLFNVIWETESSNADEEIVWSFQGCSFFHPFFISALSLYKHNCAKRILIEDTGNYTRSYLELIHFGEALMLNDAEETSNIFELYKNKSYIPICKFGTSEATIDSVTTGLQRIMQSQQALPTTVRSALSYMMGEIVTNIHDHSKSKHGYMFSQFLKKEKCLHLCIADNGISIYGSFVNSGKFDPKLLVSQGEVLNMALSHCSTKNRPEAENRGFGLPTTKNMLANGMNGSFFIMSGNAFHSHDRFGEQTVMMPTNIEWDGTIVLLKIPIEVPRDFNYLKYVSLL